MSWPKVPIVEVATITSGATPSTSNPAYWDGDIAWVTPKDISDLNGQKFLCSTPRSLTAEGLKACSAEVLPPLSVLFSSRAPIGLVAINKIPVATNQGFKSFIPDAKRLDTGYLYHWLRSNRQSIERLGVGATFKEVSKAIVARIEIPLPPLEEQRRIAAILDQAEELRAQRRAAIALLDQLPQAIFLEMFGDPITNPMGWPVKMLGQVCDVRDGTHDSPKYVSEHGYPLVTSKNVTQGHIDLSKVLMISEEDFAQINKRSKVSRGDIIMPMIGTIGYPVLVTEEPKFAIKNLALIKFQDDSPHNAYILQLLSSPYFNYVTASRNRGGTQKFVSLGDLRSLPTPVPPKGLQQKFATRLAAISRAKSSHQTALVVLQALLSSLQHQLFEGSPRVAKELSRV